MKIVEDLFSHFVHATIAAATRQRRRLTMKPASLTMTDPGQTPAPLTPTLALTWLNSLGTGAITNGVFFIADQRYHFSPMANATLGVVVGAMYVAGALGVGPALGRLAGRRRRISTRGALSLLMLASACVCALPGAVQKPWSIWVFVALYMPLTGAVWPIVESYVSGGRSGTELRRAIGWFNLAWASSVVAVFWGMGPAMARAPLAVMTALGGVHLVCLVVTLAMWREAGASVRQAGEPHPESYERLLPCCRWLLVLSYVLIAAMNPLLPWLLEGLRVEVAWKTPMASVWMVGRLGMFALFQCWQGWHGKWRTPVWTTGAMLGGFALTLAAPGMAGREHGAGIMGVAAGLALFGVGVGGVYCAALYYAMVVGKAEIEAGGRHEATIGAGYTLGPLFGVAAWGLVRAQWLAPAHVNMGILGFVGALSIVAIVAAIRAGKGHAAPVVSSL